jgi:hypothetical protein
VDPAAEMARVQVRGFNIAVRRGSMHCGWNMWCFYLPYKLHSLLYFILSAW